MSYKEVILTARLNISELESKLKFAQLELKNVLASCPHEWKGPIKGYEHEGLYCAHCGISDLALVIKR
jgi:hypothetical protein